MSMKDGGSAFPRDRPSHPHAAANDMGSHGMSLRDYFAANAPPPPSNWYGGQKSTKESIVDWQWSYADAMLKAREVTE